MKIKWLLLILIICGAFQSSLPFSAVGSPKVLKVSYGLPQTNYTVESTRWFVKEFEKRTGGQYKVEEYWGGTLGKVQDLPTLVANGAVDFFCSGIGYTPAIFKLTRGFELMYLTENPYATSAAFWDMYNSFPPLREEWDKSGLIYCVRGTVGGMIVQSKNPLNSIADMKGVKARGYAAVVKTIKQLGGAPIALAYTEIHEALNRGLIDAAFGVPYNSIYSSKFWEVAPHVSDIGVGIYSLGICAMSQKTYDSFSPEVKKIFDKLREDAQIEYRKIMESGDREETKRIINQKSIQLIMWSPEEKTKAKNMVVPAIWEDWLKEMQEAKLPGEEFLQTYRKLLQKYEAQFPYNSPFEYYKSLKKS